MATQLQIRRGTTSQMNAFTGAEGELAVNTTTDTVHVHDGSTAGGHALAKADGSNIATYAGSFTTLAASGAATLSSTLAVTGALTANGTVNVHTGSAGTVSPSTQADDLVIENSAEGGMTIITPDNQSARIRFTSPSTNTDVGGATIFYRQNINKMLVGTAVSGGKLALASGAGNETLLLDGSGNVGLGTSSISSWTKLQVAGTAGAQTGASQALYITSPSTTANEGVGIRMSAASGSHEAVGIIGMVNNASGNAGSMTFHTYNGGADVPERIRVTSTGTTGFFGAAANTRSDITLTTGTSDSNKRWGFGGGATGNNAVFYVINESNVGMFMSHGAQAWTAHSDERIKENIVSVGTVLPTLMNMRCVKYNLKSNPADTKIGFIAQDWESNFPEIVDENEHLVLEDDGTIGTHDDSDSTTPVKAMAYTETIPLLLKAIQEQQATIESQATAITDLTTRLTALENN